MPTEQTQNNCTQITNLSFKSSFTSPSSPLARSSLFSGWAVFQPLEVGLQELEDLSCDALRLRVAAADGAEEAPLAPAAVVVQLQHTSNQEIGSMLAVEAAL